ncbi:ScpA family protein [Aliiglaciecola sp. LCG003]|uniref:segregation and condensation protein A n=1 Tax=Aliiglaciecola sp. LCG003 TaxID=3053655 RepID=UPI002573FD65|nr:ScpA family protein [Aliiglaciecola sp. LCG003]WJG10852.1 ScpA family protein [Aliiglaciecola sp. LCG003]
MKDTQAPKAPIQQPLPLAFVNGEAMLVKPEDLYIPPDALEVILEAFEGPLDLLLYLIRKHKFDIVNLPILQITQQYMQYVEVMKDLKLELAAEYLLMAAILAEVKSRLLLPKRPDAEDEEDDPRAELIRRLQEYEAIKLAAQEMDGLPRLERDVFVAHGVPSDSVEPIKIQPQVNLQDVVLAFQSVLKKVKAFEHHQIAREALSTRERMSKILQQLSSDGFSDFELLFTVDEGKAGVVVSFLAILELVKEQLVELVQAHPLSQIHLKLRSMSDSDDTGEALWQS